VIVGDPGRAYAPTGVEMLATYDIPVIRDLEDRDIKRVHVVRIV
jgi:predicted nicotinamide N-methyase